MQLHEPHVKRGPMKLEWNVQHVKGRNRSVQRGQLVVGECRLGMAAKIMIKCINLLTFSK